MKSILTDIARQAGSIMLKHWRKLSEEQVEKKSSPKDLVTFVDLEVERYVRQRVANELPDHVVIGEERGGIAILDRPSLIVDPIDGTTNYAQGLPHFAISIARQFQGEITHGLIYLPVFDEMFWAEAGGGAYMNGEKLQVSDKNVLIDCMVATGFACVRAGMKPDTVPAFNELVYKTRDMRRLGAATVDLAYVARGIFDGFYELGLSSWDVSAGALMVLEAGGEVSGFFGIDDFWSGKAIMATNGYIHETLKREVEEAMKL
jgi:myo-inositol-1(or 4)-monophosphatase